MTFKVKLRKIPLNTWQILNSNCCLKRSFKDKQIAPKPRLMPMSRRIRAQCCAYNSNSVHIISDQIETNGPCGPTEPHYWWMYFTALSTVETNSYRKQTLTVYGLQIEFWRRCWYLAYYYDHLWMYRRSDMNGYVDLSGTFQFSSRLLLCFLCQIIFTGRGYL